MPSPESASPAVSVTDPAAGPRAAEIAALTDNYQWGSRTGEGVNLGFSFPWTASSQAVFAGAGGTSYSAQGEDQAAQRFGLNAVQQAAAASALQAWANVADIRLTPVADTSTAVGDIRIAFSSAIPAATWGWAYAPYPDYPAGGDIWIGTQVAEEGSTVAKWAPGTRNHLSLLHEIGHALGLKHPFEGDPLLATSFDNRRHTVMSYSDATGDLYPNAGWVDGRYDWLTYQVLPDTPMLLDIAAVQHLYGPNRSYRQGDDTWGFDPTVPFFSTIWDAGGSDTLSAAGFTRPCTIDLRDGQFSSLRFSPPTNPAGATPTYDGTHNVAIAFGCVIEHAIGGAGDDTLIGNAADNRLEGGAGLDTVVVAGARTAMILAKHAGDAWSLGGVGGTDTLIGIERIRFADRAVALDLQGNAGIGLKVLGAVFGPAVAADPLARGIALHAADSQGNGLEPLAQLALTARLGPNPSHGEVVDLLHANLVGRLPDAGSRAVLVDLLDRGLYSRAGFAAAVADLDLNRANIDYAGVALRGLDYLPFAG
jgi:serralysin